jgi:hypothetical protein
METLMIIVATLVVVFWVVCNVYVAKNYTTKEMYEDLVVEQSKVGRVLACGFYSLAWFWKVMVA